MNRTVENGMDGASPGGIGWLTGRQPFVDQLFAASGATSWGLPRGLFAAALEHSASKRFGEESPGAGKIEEYLSALHLQDLALACACAEGRPDAWDHFVAAFRGYMRSAASAILRCPPDSPAACELADSLFADLYGLGEGANRRSLFRYFHGRSSLKTWLRAVLAQRHIDAIRASRRFRSRRRGRPRRAALCTACRTAPHKQRRCAASPGSASNRTRNPLPPHPGSRSRSSRPARPRAPAFVLRRGANPGGDRPQTGRARIQRFPQSRAHPPRTPSTRRASPAQR